MNRIRSAFTILSSALVSAIATVAGVSAAPPDPTATSNAAAATAPLSAPGAALPSGATLAPGPVDVTCDGVHVGTFASLAMHGAQGSGSPAGTSPNTAAYKVESSSLKYARVSLKYGFIDHKAVDGFIKMPKTSERTCEVTENTGGKLERYTMVGTWTRVDAKGLTGMEGGEKPAPSFDVHVTSLKHQ